MELGKIIGILIKKKKMTQVHVAKEIGKSTTALSQIIQGNYNPNHDTLNKICEVLEIPLPILYFLTISEDDIPEDKIELYKLLAPTIKEFIVKVFGTEKENLFSEINHN